MRILVLAPKPEPILDISTAAATAAALRLCGWPGSWGFREMSGNFGRFFTLEANDARRELEPEDVLGAAKLPLRCKFDADACRCNVGCRCKNALPEDVLIENERDL